MATTAETLASYDLLQDQERRATEYPERWKTVEAELATLLDGTGDAAATVIALADLKLTRHRPIDSGALWADVRAQIAVLDDEA